jgi:hypothetical protein
VIAASLATSSGCSFIFSEGAPDRHETRENFTCGESNAPPVLDSISAGLLALSVAGLTSDQDATVAMKPPSQQDDTRREINVSIGVATAFALIDAASAIYGFHAVASCRGAREARQLALVRAAALPPPYGVPPAGGPPPYWPPPSAYAPPPAYVPPPAPYPQPAVPPEDIPPPPVTPLPPAPPSP